MRGARRLRSLLPHLSRRVSVTGTRGKTDLVRRVEREYRHRGYSTYAKVSGTDPASIRDGVEHPIERPERMGALLQENTRELIRWCADGVDLACVENQGITPYTLRVANHRYIRGHYVLIPNIRRDHVADLGSDLRLHARAYAGTALPGSTIVLGEPDPHLRDAVRAHAGRFVDVVDAVPTDDDPPGFENVTVLDALLRHQGLPGLTDERKAAERRELDGHFAWQPSALPQVDWFHGAEVNDVDSTAAVLRHLQRGERRELVVFGYFREDRRSRTATFAPFLRQLLEEEYARKVVLAGAGALPLRRWFRGLDDRVELVRDDLAAVPTLLGDLSRLARGGAVLTVGNGVPPFPRAVAAGLDPERAAAA